MEKTEDVKALQQEIPSSTICKAETSQKPVVPIFSSGSATESQTSGWSEVKVEKTEDVKESQQGLTSSSIPKTEAYQGLPKSSEETSNTIQKTETSPSSLDLKSSEEPSKCRTTESSQVEKIKPSGHDQDISTSSLNGGDYGKAEDEKTKPIDVVEAKDQM